MLLQSKNLATAYHLKELFYDFIASQSREIANPKLNFFILAVQSSELKEFNSYPTMLGNWSKYILNAFNCPYTNGYTEGTNTSIKIINRNAFGYRNFDNFRNRIILARVTRQRLKAPQTFSSFKSLSHLTRYICPLKGLILLIISLLWLRSALL